VRGAPILRPFGPTGKTVPVIGQGTWKMGAARDRAEEVRALRRGIELGLRHIDTAEMYGDGLAEEAIAEAIAGVPRDDLFIVSKVLPQHARMVPS
jgi:diketogulonate reductase-like aldo/keto reductase